MGDVDITKLSLEDRITHKVGVTIELAPTVAEASIC